MKAAVIGHVSIDLIKSKDSRHVSLGGAPIYSGKTLSELGVRTEAITKIGKRDLIRFKVFFEKNSIDFKLSKISSEFETTKFLIKLEKRSWQHNRKHLVFQALYVNVELFKYCITIILHNILDLLLGSCTFNINRLLVIYTLIIRKFFLWIRTLKRV